MSVNKTKDFIFENYFKRRGKKSITIQWNIKKKDLKLLATELRKEIPESSNAKE